MKLSAVVTCKNEEEVIADCLEGVKWADEIFVVDSGSTDKTVEIARSYGARVEFHEYVDQSHQSNWAIERASHEWIIFLDADERLSPELAEEIRSLRAKEDGPDVDGYVIYRKTLFFGKVVRRCGWSRDRVTRLFKRDKTRYPDERIHVDAHVDGKVGRLRGFIIHNSFRDFSRLMEKVDRQTTWKADDLQKGGHRAGIVNLLLRPAWRFFRMYVLQGGFLAGRRGAMVSMLGAFSVFLKYAKLWVRQRVNA